MAFQSDAFQNDAFQIAGAVPVADVDAFTLQDGTVVLQVQDAEPFTLGEALLLQASANDSITLTETGAVLVMSGEAFTLGDSGLVGVLGAEQGTLAEAAVVVVLDADSFLLGDGGAGAVDVSAGDTGTLSEAALLEVLASEQVTLQEAIGIQLADVDAATLQEAAVLASLASDSAALQETAQLTVLDVEAGLLQEAALAQTGQVADADLMTLLEDAGLTLADFDFAILTELAEVFQELPPELAGWWLVRKRELAARELREVFTTDRFGLLEEAVAVELSADLPGETSAPEVGQGELTGAAALEQQLAAWSAPARTPRGGRPARKAAPPPGRAITRLPRPSTPAPLLSETEVMGLLGARKISRLEALLLLETTR